MRSLLFLLDRSAKCVIACILLASTSYESGLTPAGESGTALRVFQSKYFSFGRVDPPRHTGHPFPAQLDTKDGDAPTLAARGPPVAPAGANEKDS